MSQPKLLNEYKAAAKVGLSPTLLGWLAKYSPKQGNPRKLKIEKKKGVLFVDEEELLDFNEWLKLPWPQKDGKRPPVPSGIREEIKTEANGECAICQSHKDTCEAAHLDPVANSKNNHPENLLWLCSNHHIAYDDGLFGPDHENAEFVCSFKRVLHRHKKMLWSMQDELSRKLFSILADCGRLAEQLTLAKTELQVRAVERLATNTLAIVPKLGPISRTDTHYKAYKSISLSLGSLSTNITQEHTNVKAKLREAQNIQKRYLTALGFVACPLCKTTGQHDGYDCPECGGEGEMPQRRAEKVDVSQYKDVKCPLCEGRGTFQNDDCPECGGEGEMPQWRAEKVDVSQHEEIACPHCGGKGLFRGDDCSFCDGNGKVTRRAAERFESS
jgi:hypothetical protein